MIFQYKLSRIDALCLLVRNNVKWAKYINYFGFNAFPASVVPQPVSSILFTLRRNFQNNVEYEVRVCMHIRDASSGRPRLLSVSLCWNKQKRKKIIILGNYFGKKKKKKTIFLIDLSISIGVLSFRSLL